MKRNLTGIAICSLAVMLASSAYAADYNFTVPVDVQNLPVTFVEGKVECSVSRTASETLGTGEQFFGIDSLGNFQDDLEVAVNVSADDNPADVTRYECLLFLREEGGQFQPVQGGPGSRYNANPRASASISQAR